MNEIYTSYIPCVPPGAICDVAYAYERKKLERVGELGRITLEKGTENWYEDQYFEINLRRFGNLYGKLRLDAVWVNDGSNIKISGEYWGRGYEYERRYKEAKHDLIEILEQLRLYATNNCKHIEIKILIFTFIEEKVGIRIT